MTINLLKIAAGISSVPALVERFEARGEYDPEMGFVVPVITRNVPRQREALLAGGSIYWIIKGQILVRSEIVALSEAEDGDGRRLCIINIAPILHPVVPTKRRGFQGWRYFKPADAPPDIDVQSVMLEDQDIEMAAELLELGLL